MTYQNPGLQDGAPQNGVQQYGARSTGHRNHRMDTPSTVHLRTVAILCRRAFLVARR